MAGNLIVTSKTHPNRKPTVLDLLVAGAMPLVGYLTQCVKQITGETLAWLLAAIILLIYLIVICVRDRRRYFDKSDAIIVLCLVSAFGIHLMILPVYFKEIRMFALFTMVLLAGRYLTEQSVRVFGVTVTIISLLLTADVVVHVGWYIENGYGLYNVRLSTLCDKPTYAAYYSMSLIALMFGILKCRSFELAAFQVILFAVFSFVGIFIIQSKIMLLTFFAIGLWIAVRIGKKNPERVVIGILFLVLFAIVFIGFFSQFMPDSIKSLLAVIFGVDPGAISENQFLTYSVRSSITITAIKLFAGNPVAGIGFGGFALAAPGYFSDWGAQITDVESSWLSFAVEGGLLYLLAHITILFRILKPGLAARMRKSFDYMDWEAWLYVLVMILLCIANDFAEMVLYWVVITIGAGVASKFRGSARSPKQELGVLLS